MLTSARVVRTIRARCCTKKSRSSRHTKFKLHAALLLVDRRLIAQFFTNDFSYFNCADFGTGNNVGLSFVLSNAHIQPTKLHIVIAQSIG